MVKMPLMTLFSLVSESVLSLTEYLLQRGKLKKRKNSSLKIY